jgi:hypothetical protein
MVKVDPVGLPKCFLHLWVETKAIRWGDYCAIILEVILNVFLMAQAAPLPQMIMSEPEQVFLAKHYDALSKARDPRDILTRQPQTGDAGGVTSYGTGVVGPMQSSTFSGYHVDKVIRELEGEDVPTKIAKITGGAAAAAASAAAAPPRRVTKFSFSLDTLSFFFTHRNRPALLHRTRRRR